MTFKTWKPKYAFNYTRSSNDMYQSEWLRCCLAPKRCNKTNRCVRKKLVNWIVEATQKQTSIKFYFNNCFHTFILYKVMYTQFTPMVYKETIQCGREGGKKERQHSEKVNTQRIFQQNLHHGIYSIDLKEFVLMSTYYCQGLMKP